MGRRLRGDVRELLETLHEVPRMRGISVWAKQLSTSHGDWARQCTQLVLYFSCSFHLASFFPLATPSPRSLGVISRRVRWRRVGSRKFSKRSHAPPRAAGPRGSRHRCHEALV